MTSSIPSLNQVIESCIYVDDLDAALPFYRDLLGLELVTAEMSRHLFFKCGNSMVLVFKPEATLQPGCRGEGHVEVPTHGAQGPGHLAFAVTEDELEVWRARFQEFNCPVEMEIEWPGGGHSLYVRDPGNNSIEVVTPKLWDLQRI